MTKCDECNVEVACDEGVRYEDGSLIYWDVKTLHEHTHDSERKMWRKTVLVEIEFPIGALPRMLARIPERELSADAAKDLTSRAVLDIFDRWMAEWYFASFLTRLKPECSTGISDTTVCTKCREPDYKHDGPEAIDDKCTLRVVAK